MVGAAHFYRLDAIAGHLDKWSFKLNKLDKYGDDDLIDPDPLSVMLIALGAAGSVASLYAVVETRMRDHEQERQINRNAIRDAIFGAESALNELRGLMKSYEIAFATGAAGRRDEEDSRVKDLRNLVPFSCSTLAQGTIASVRSKMT